AGLLHLLVHAGQQSLLFAFKDVAEVADLPAIVLLGDAEIARGGALPDAVEDARAKPAPALVVGLDVERAGAELEDPLQDLHGNPQALGTSERPIELHAASPRRARELDARKV